MGQLAKQMVERPTSSFGANIKKNPKEECKTVLTRSHWRVQGEEEKAEGDQLEEERDEPVTLCVFRKDDIYIYKKAFM